MQERNTIQEYLDSVTAQIRWKRARPLVRQELAHHLEDQRAAFYEALGTIAGNLERLCAEEDSL